MVFYVAHAFSGDEANIEKAKKITRDLQVNDLENTYICPLLTFSHLQYGELGYDAEIELCKDILMICDKLIVAGDTISRGVDIEINFAHLLGMEVEYLEPQDT